MPDIIQLDIHGQICPSCLLLTLKALNEHGPDMRRGEAEIVVMTDDRQATSTIPEAATKMGYRSEITRAGNGYRIRIHA
jgi:TusA-related sulfurtransferase